MINISNNIPLIVAFSAGLLSFLSPCVLPLIPAYISYLTGSAILKEQHQDKSQVLKMSLWFVLGFSIIFILLGASVTFLGKILLLNQLWLRRLGGALIIIFGIHTLGIFKIKLFYREKRFFKLNIYEKNFNPLFMGMAFAAGWTPCVGPILSSILIYAGNMETVGKGVLLLIFYSLGLAIPFILSAAAIDTFSKNLRRYTKYLPVISTLSGILMIIMGIMIFTNKVGLLSSYLNFLNFY